MIKINVITKNKKWLCYINNPSSYIDKKIRKLNLKNKKYKKNIFHCTILLSGNLEIKKLNKKFRKKNKITDVLSFPYYTKKNLNKIIKKNKEIYLGDIIINLSKVNDKKNIEAFKLNFDLLWIHGFTHLFGYDHKGEKEYRVMRRIEKNYLQYIT
ncbi:rRNA maturation RNase YbeY [Pelagibacteraceae bacterium]|jgi:probable rRNA maturation factor|nr:rRNA maturation RNase YbeY [Pelagibacteraceae bacterium]